MRTEMVQVECRPGTTEWMFSPSLSLGPVGGQLGHISHTQSNNKACVISLDASSNQEENPSIEW